MITARPLTAEAFAPYGDVIALRDKPDKVINQGLCRRHHDLAVMDFADGRAGISLFEADAITLPYSCAMMERHPSGSQAFLPMEPEPFLVIVAEDKDGPHMPVAFLTAPGAGVNYHRGVWHGVLTPLKAMCFAVVDRIGPGANLEEHWLDVPLVVSA